MKKNIDRRIFLRGLGGACVAAPFLPSLAEKTALGQASAKSNGKRLIVMFTHYGCVTDRWFPMSSHGVLDDAAVAGTTLEAFTGMTDKMTVVRGVRAMNEWNDQAIRGQGNDPHTQVVGTYFTCVPVTPHTSNPFSFEPATKFNAMPTAPSLDHVCAAQISASGSPLFMRVGNKNDSPQSGISYSGSEEPFPGAGTPSQAFSQITGLFMDGEPVSQDTYASLRGKAVSDLVRDDLQTLRRMPMSASDHKKLDDWEALLNDTGGGVISAACNQELADSLGLTEMVVSQASQGNLGGDSVAGSVGDLYIADIYSNVAVLAAACNANPVIFLKYPGNHTFGGLGLTMENHSISHRIGNAGMGGPCIANVNEDLLTMDRFYADRFAYMVKQLDSINEGDSTLLDNCVATWVQEVSDGNAHNLNNMPIIQAGSCGGYFKTGQIINVEDGATTDMHRGDSFGPCDGGGNVTGKSTWTPPEFGNAPINKYYCNLMNAVGVKAGPDGFPAEDGDQEVTHYGRYDRTEDFSTGDAAPANISDPGEFTYLRA